MEYFLANWIQIVGMVVIPAIALLMTWLKYRTKTTSGVYQTMVNTRGSRQVAQTPNARQDMRDTTDSEQQG